MSKGVWLRPTMTKARWIQVKSVSLNELALTQLRPPLHWLHENFSCGWILWKMMPAQETARLRDSCASMDISACVWTLAWSPLGMPIAHAVARVNMQLCLSSIKQLPQQSRKSLSRGLYKGLVTYNTSIQTSLGNGLFLLHGEKFPCDRYKCCSKCFIRGSNSPRTPLSLPPINID